MPDVEFGRCRDCKHWDQKFFVGVLRLCNRSVDLLDEFGNESDLPADSFCTWAVGGEGHEGSELWTGPEFGCIQFKKRETT